MSCCQHKFRGSITGDMKSFDDAFHLVTTSEKVHDYNCGKFLQLCLWLATIEASHNCVKDKQATLNIACNSEGLLIVQRCSVTLGANQWVAKGLVKYCNRHAIHISYLGLVKDCSGHAIHITYLEYGPLPLPLVVASTFLDILHRNLIQNKQTASLSLLVPFRM